MRAGGDGTPHEVVTNLLALPEGERPEVGYVPAGTTNDFAKNLSLSGSLNEDAVVAAAGVPRPVDIGSFNEKNFIYIAAFGAFTDVAYNTPQQVKSMLGHLAYVLEGATRLGSIQPHSMTVEYDGGIVADSFCYGMVSNTISVGGFKGTPAQPVALDAGLFEVALVRQPQNPLQLQAIFKALANMADDDGGLVTCFRTTKLKLTSQEALDWTLDGEFGGSHKQVEIVNHMQAVTIVHGA